MPALVACFHAHRFGPILHVTMNDVMVGLLAESLRDLPSKTPFVRNVIDLLEDADAELPDADEAEPNCDFAMFEEQGLLALNHAGRLALREALMYHNELPEQVYSLRKVLGMSEDALRDDIIKRYQRRQERQLSRAG